LINHPIKQGGKSLKLTIKDISRLGIIAALYVALTFITYPISFLGIQFRVAEILVFLCFFKKDYIISLTIGCVLVNLASPIGFIDAAIGAGATLLSCLVLMFSKWLIVGVFSTTIINAFLVGFELWYFVKEPFWVSVGLVAIGEVVVLTVGYVLIMYFKKRPKLLEIIKANQNVDFKF